jgi:hypothetical protein
MGRVLEKRGQMAPNSAKNANNLILGDRVIRR